MHAVDSESFEHTAVARVKLIATCALLVLLLVCHLSLATDSLAPNTYLSGPGLLEIDDPEREYQNPATPDFLLAAEIHLLHSRRNADEYGSAPPGHEVHTSLTDIRAPPGFS